MRDLEHRRYIEGVVCPHVPLRVFSKRERSRMEKQGLIFFKAKLQKSGIFEISQKI